MSENKELWLQNLSKADVSLSDVGVKIPMGKTINVYKSNPYLTEDKVKQSMRDGAIFKRLKADTLKLVHGYSNPNPHTLNHLKASNSVVEIVKTKSSVVIDTQDIDVLEDGDLEGIADYGFEPVVEVRNVSQVRTEDGSVVVKQDQDDDVDEGPAPIVEPEQVGKAVVMAGGDKNPNPLLVAGDELGESKPFVLQPPEPEPEPETPKSVTAEVGKDESGAVIAAGKTVSNRSILLIQAMKETADKLGVKVEDLPPEVRGQLAADMVIKSEPTPFDSKVATKTDNGAVIMKIKQEASKEE